jgi:hypothetical protein
MLEAGRAGDVVPLARGAVERVTDGPLHIDDSCGVMGDDLRELTGHTPKEIARALGLKPADVMPVIRRSRHRPQGARRRWRAAG